MGKRDVTILVFFLDFKMKSIIQLVILINVATAQMNLYDLNHYHVNRDTINYTSNAMIKSFIIPGWGQFQNNDPIWKPLAFLTFEIVGLSLMIDYNKRGEEVRKDFEAFADKHWTLERWYNNTKAIFPGRWEEALVGTHKLQILINDDYYYTDQLAYLKNNYSWNEIFVIRDRDFYENIGKYDQFVGGWDDPFDNPFDDVGKWYTIKKGNVESIILTQQKDYYRDLRNDSNILKYRAKNTLSILMLNHLLSGLEAGLKSKVKYDLFPKVRFYSNMQNTYGVQGVKISYEW